MGDYRNNIKAHADSIRPEKVRATHQCPWPDCTTEVLDSFWGCTRHYNMLPSNLRAKVFWRLNGVHREKVFEEIELWIILNG